jgi:hypothetical protein
VFELMFLLDRAEHIPRRFVDADSRDLHDSILIDGLLALYQFST